MASKVPFELGSPARAHLLNFQQSPLLVKQQKPAESRSGPQASVMIPQDLANCLVAAGHLKHAAPVILQAMPAIEEHDSWLLFSMS